MKLPKVTSTSELQRNIGVLAKSDNIHIITKGSKELGVYIPMDIFHSMNDEGVLREPSTSYSLEKPDMVIPKGLKEALKSIDSVKYQRNIRKEY